MHVPGVTGAVSMTGLDVLAGTAALSGLIAGVCSRVAPGLLARTETEAGVLGMAVGYTKASSRLLASLDGSARPRLCLELLPEAVPSFDGRKPLPSSIFLRFLGCSPFWSSTLIGESFVELGCFVRLRVVCFLPLGFLGLSTRHTSN
jgi:hypothetical protein